MAYIPKRPPIEKRALGALEYRKGHRDADAMQSLHGGKRYNIAVTKKLAEEDRQKVLSKVEQRKQRTKDEVVIDPVKNDIVGPSTTGL